GIWNVPHIMDCYLLNRNSIQKLHNKRITGDADLGFANLLRKEGMFMFVSNLVVYGKLTNNENYNISLPKPDLYQIFDNYDQWTDKYIHPDVWSMLDGNRMPKEPLTDTYYFPFTTHAFCDDLVATAVASNAWSGGKNQDPRIPGGYENVPTDDVHMTQIGFSESWHVVLQNFIMPIQRKLFQGYTKEPPSAPLSFVVRYHPEKQDRLKPHHDSSTYTLNIALNQANVDYEGGGVRFIRYHTIVKDIKKGWLLIHPGRLTHLHEGLPTTNADLDTLEELLLELNPSSHSSWADCVDDNICASVSVFINSLTLESIVKQTSTVNTVQFLLRCGQQFYRSDVVTISVDQTIIKFRELFVFSVYLSAGGSADNAVEITLLINDLEIESHSLQLEHMSVVKELQGILNFKNINAEYKVSLHLNFNYGIFGFGNSPKFDDKYYTLLQLDKQKIIALSSLFNWDLGDDPYTLFPIFTNAKSLSPRNIFGNQLPSNYIDNEYYCENVTSQSLELENGFQLNLMHKLENGSTFEERLSHIDAAFAELDEPFFSDSVSCEHKEDSGSNSTVVSDEKSADNVCLSDRIRHCVADLIIQIRSILSY
ncbi:hypothetical protein GJ496_010367, partial [Pomphorhynchus laevis]